MILAGFSQSKLLQSSLWSFIDRLMAYNIVLAQIPGRAKAAADILLRKQTDPSQSLQIQLLDQNLMQQIETDMKAKTPDTSLLSLESNSISNENR